VRYQPKLPTGFRWDFFCLDLTISLNAIVPICGLDAPWGGRGEPSVKLWTHRVSALPCESFLGHLFGYREKAFMPENAGQNQGRWEKGQSGNPRGKPRGARNRATLLAEALLDGEAEALTRTAIEKALEGDGMALRLCLERVLPARKERPISFSMPAIASAGDAAKAMGALLAAVAAGNVTPSEAGEVSKIVEVYFEALQISEFEQRLKALEERADAAYATF
jgi:Family of unknown function (DUF5681)